MRHVFSKFRGLTLLSLITAARPTCAHDISTSYNKSPRNAPSGRESKFTWNLVSSVLPKFLAEQEVGHKRVSHERVSSSRSLGTVVIDILFLQLFIRYVRILDCKRIRRHSRLITRKLGGRRSENVFNILPLRFYTIAFSP